MSLQWISFKQTNIICNLLHNSNWIKKIVFIINYIHTYIFFLGYQRGIDFMWVCNFIAHTVVSSIFCCTFAGDQICGRGLQAACSHGLPCCSAHPHAGLLAEGSQREATLLPDSHRSWQANPQPREPEVYGHALQVGGPLNRSIFTAKRRVHCVTCWGVLLI